MLNDIENCQDFIYNVDDFNLGKSWWQLLWNICTSTPIHVTMYV